MIEIRKIHLPTVNGNLVEVETSQSILFIGANGSGKTRLGAWLHNKNEYRPIIHRVSAQRVLRFPNRSELKSLESSEQAVLNGMEGFSDFHRGKEAVYFQDDFSKLLNFLHSDDMQQSVSYKNKAKNTTERVAPPISKLDIIQRVWEKILPHRSLLVGALDIQTFPREKTDQIYKSSEMSDGERVIFYLLGHCLAVPNNGIMVIDEPEIHLHKSIQISLWNEIEKLRPDCLFIYLTHDVDFAAAKENSKKIWLKNYDGNCWDWEEISEDEQLPNELLIEILGSRKPIVFVEGENGSFDVSLYREILSEFLVIPRGSCTQVIQSVKALKANAQLHHLDVYGIIDRDRRPQHEINALEQDSVYVLAVAEVENLFCTPEILKIISSKLERDIEQDFQTVSVAIFNRLRSELETQISLHVSGEIKFLLNMFDANKKGEQDINQELQRLCSSIDISGLYALTKQKFEQVLADNNYTELLAIYNRKSLASQASEALGLAKKSLPETVVRFARGTNKDEIKNALKPYFGGFSQFIN